MIQYFIVYILGAELALGLAAVVLMALIGWIMWKAIFKW